MRIKLKLGRLGMPCKTISSTSVTTLVHRVCNMTDNSIQVRNNKTKPLVKFPPLPWGRGEVSHITHTWHTAHLSKLSHWARTGRQTWNTNGQPHSFTTVPPLQANDKLKRTPTHSLHDSKPKHPENASDKENCVTCQSVIVIIKNYIWQPISK